MENTLIWCVNRVFNDLNNLSNNSPRSIVIISVLVFIFILWIASCNEYNSGCDGGNPKEVNFS